MTVQCAKCGEELLGAVNRCWRCGTRIDVPASTGRFEGPAPPALSAATGDAGDEVVEAELVTGSGVATVRPAVPVPAPALPRPSRYPRWIAAQGGAIAALLLGLISFVAGFYTALAAIPAAVGVLMGIWGLFAPRRGPAVLGLVLCCIALAIASINGAVGIYQRAYGHAPWEAPAEPPEY
jgi:hypothetical protein